MKTILPFAFVAAILPLHGQVTLLDSAAEKLVAPDAKVEKLAGGFKFTEGPVWLPDRKILVFSDIPASKLMQWSESGGIADFRPSEQANGNTLDNQGRLISCQHAARNIVRAEPDGTVKVLLDRYQGKRFNSPNDAAVKRDGTIWFTDPPYGLPSGQAKEQEGNRVYRFDPAKGSVTIVNKDFDMPNGIAFSPDEKRLYIADSGKGQRVGAFDVRADGTLGPAVWWAEGGSDGMRVDEKGNLYTTAGDGVRIYSPEGKHLANIACPEQPANCAFGGDDFKSLFITARTGLYRIKLGVAGNRLGKTTPSK
ncbi:MAG: SMP-30/gluconolactonase/LRE family protein [Verrucomicrobia bacterium]|nr:SMP-30/gluconolactonase/LRE family protein [Verrucomicrobiota bacterium]